MLPGINENVTINELTRLNDSLRKNSEVGYQSSSMGAGSLAPIVPQSIEGTLASAAHTMRDLALWPMLPKIQATNTLHEYAVIRDHGEDLDPFISEGGGSEFGASASSYERKSVKIKYMAEKRSVSDVATLVGIVGPNADALAEETERGTMSLLRKMEVQLFHGDEDVNGLSFDGVLKQVERESGVYSPFRFGRDFSENQEDLQGASLSGAKLHEKLGELYSAPRFGQPDAIFMSPKAYSKLIADSAQNGRHDSMVLVDKGDQGVHTLGAGPRIHVMGPMGPVPVVAAPFISRRLSPPRAASAGNDIALQAVAANRLTTQDTQTAAQFAAAAGALVPPVDDSVGWDAAATGAGHDGDFRYFFVLVNKKGYSEPIVSTVAFDANDDSLPRINLAAPTSGSADYVRIYRAAGDATLSDAEVLRKAQLIGEVKAADIVGADWYDAGFERLDADPVLIAQLDQGTMEFARLLDFIRRPLAEVGAAKQFLLMLFGAPSVKVPRKNFVLRNVGR